MKHASVNRPSWDSLKRVLATLPPLAQLPNSELDRLALGSRAVDARKGETVFTEGQKAGGVWLLESGRIEIFKYTTGGRAMAIESVLPGQWIGTLCRISGDRQSYPCTAVAAVDSRLINIQEIAFWPLLEQFPLMLGGFCRLCSQKLSELRELPATNLEPSDKRVIKTMLHLSDEHGLELPFSRREISELAGTAPETTIRVLGALERRKWVVALRGRVVLKEIEKLRSYLSNH